LQLILSSPYLNHFIQPDTVIPNPANPQSWNRYSYVLNSPINFNDPTGHNADCGIGDSVCQGGWWYIFYRGASGERTQSEKLSRGITDTLAELDVMGFFKETGDVDDVIGQVNRSKLEAHLRSTATSLVNGDISIEDLLETPVDSDGNEWLPANCVNQSGIVNEGCIKANALSIYYSLGDPMGKWNMVCMFLLYCDKAWLQPAYEGYAPGSQERLPNGGKVPISMHTLGLAVDLSYINMNQSQVNQIQSIAASNGLCQPISFENWHYESC